MNLIYDVETYRLPKTSEEWDLPWTLGFGSAVVYHTQEDIYHFFGYEDLDKLVGLLSAATNVIGFNNKKFDDLVVMGKYAALPCNSVDLFEVLVMHKFAAESIEDAILKAGRSAVFNGSLNLGSISQGTFGRKKIDKGSHAPMLIEQRRWAELYQYNLDDVRLTSKLFCHIGKGKDVTDKRGRIYKGMLPDECGGGLLDIMMGMMK